MEAAGLGSLCVPATKIFSYSTTVDMPREDEKLRVIFTKLTNITTVFGTPSPQAARRMLWEWHGKDALQRWKMCAQLWPHSCSDLTQQPAKTTVTGAGEGGKSVASRDRGHLKQQQPYPAVGSGVALSTQDTTYPGSAFSGCLRQCT